MTTITNFSQIDGILHKHILDIIRKVGKEIQGVLKNEVNKSWYKRAGFDASKSQYDRTMQLLNSISLAPVIVTGNTYSVKIYYDTSKIVPMDGTQGKPWTRHKSVVDGSSSNEALPYYIENGNGDSSIYQYNGVHPVANVKNWIYDDKYILHRFKELLQDRGFKCIIG